MKQERFMKGFGGEPLGRTMCRWEDNINMDFQNAELEGREWIDLIQKGDVCRALMNAEINP
jgi:hypothetical protein